MEELNLSNNHDIDDNGAELLLNCLHCINKLKLIDCTISLKMQANLFESGRRKGCKVSSLW